MPSTSGPVISIAPIDVPNSLSRCALACIQLPCPYTRRCRSMLCCASASIFRTSSAEAIDTIAPTSSIIATPPR